MTTFANLLSASTGRAPDLELLVPPTWMQGRSVFGGLQAAFAIRAMRALVPDVPLRTMQMTFVGPSSSTTMYARTAILRQGKSATIAETRLVDGDDVVAICTGVFGAARRSTIAIAPVQPVVSRDTRTPMTYVEGVHPAFLQHFDAVWLRGDPPFSGSTKRDHVIEIGMRDDAPVTESHVIALADFVPPLGLSWLRAPANGSTITWMLEFVIDRFDHIASLAGWRIDAEIRAARDGYTNQNVMLWAPDGSPVAISTQSMVVFG